MEAFGEVGYLEIFGIAFMLGGAFFFCYRLLCTVGGWIPFLTPGQTKGASTVIVTAALASFFWVYYTGLLTCDRAAQGLDALRHDHPKPEDLTSGAEQYCTYYRDHCLDVGQGSDSANWTYCLQQRSVSPPV